MVQVQHGRSITARLWFQVLIVYLSATWAGARPNVLVVSIDTLRADRLGAYGYQPADTPSLDQLASESVRFERAYSTAPLTLPAHTSLFTGTYPLHHGVRDNSGYSLPEARITMAEIFQAEGYRTAAFIGAFVLDSKFGLQQGFELYYDDFDLSQVENISPGYIQRRGDEVVEEALKWLASPQNGPFFLWVHLFDPHDPYTPPEPYASAHRGRPYDGEIAFTDRVVAQLLEGVRRKGEYEETLIVIVGDHGESLGEHGEEKHGLFVYDATLRVPLLIRLPGGQRAGEVVEEPVSLVDIFPTVLQLLEIDRSRAPEIQGRGLASLVLGKGRPPAATLYAESYYPRSQFGWSPLKALIRDRYKFVQAPKPEVYDLSTDPGELRNLAAENAALASRFRQELDALEKRFYSDNAEGATLKATDSETLRKLQSLGYVAHSGVPKADPEQSQVDPKDQIELYNQILALFELSAQGKHREVIPGYLKALEAQPSLKIVRYKLGQAYFFTGDYEKALDSFKRAIELGGDDALGTFDLAQTYLRLGRLEEAVVGFERTLQLDPNHHRARINLGVLYKNRGDLEAARSQLEEALKIAPDSVEALSNLGVVHALAGRPEQAIQALQRALSERPDDARLHANLAAVYQRMGRQEDARRAMEEARRLDPRLFRKP